MSKLVFRQADTADLERLVDVHALAFPDPRGVEERRRNFMAKPFGPFADLHVAELEGDVVAHAFGFGLSTWVGGASVPVTGIATVGVAPEARGRGVGAALVRHVESVGESRGAVASFLYPFRQGFYGRLGYVPAPGVIHFAVAPAALPWERARTVKVRRARGEDRATLRELYLAHASRSTGMISRSERLWNMHLSDERRFFFVAEELGTGRPVGYVSTVTTQSESHAETRTEVVDLVGEDDAARSAQLGWLASLRDQSAEIDLVLAADDPLAWLLEDADRARHGTERVEHGLGTFATGPMLRAADPTKVLEKRGYPAELVQTFSLSVAGERFEVDVRDGRATAIASSLPDTTEATLAMTRRGFTAVVLGGLPLAHAVRLGWAIAHPREVRELGPLLDVPAWHTWDRF